MTNYSVKTCPHTGRQFLIANGNEDVELLELTEDTVAAAVAALS